MIGLDICYSAKDSAFFPLCNNSAVNEQISSDSAYMIVPYKQGILMSQPVLHKVLHKLY